MNLKQGIPAILAGAVAMWIVAGIWHEVIAARFYAAQAGAEHEGLGIIFAAYVLLSAVMAYLYPLVCRRRRPVLEGLGFGALIGVLWVLPQGLIAAGGHGESLLYVFQNTAWHLIEQGVGGVVIALIYAKVLVPAHE